MNTPRTTRPRTDWDQAAFIAMLGLGCATLGGMVIAIIVLLPQ